MEVQPNNSQIKTTGFIKICKWIWSKHSVFWSTVVLGIALNILATLLFTPWPWTNALKQLPIGVAFQSPIVVLLIGSILILFDIIIYLGSRLPIPLHDKEIEQRYLRRMILETEILSLKGIPAGLIAQGVALDEIFIPLQFRPNRPLKDYPLRTSEQEEYRKHILKGQTLDEELESLLFEAERSWQYPFNESNRISIAGLWDRLTSEQPAAVIQGFPGMGKSTFLARMTLHMARSSLHQSDITMKPNSLKPSSIPIFLSLGAYASEREKSPDLSMSDYLKFILNSFEILDLTLLIEKRLDAGCCLVMFDGLDEVSSQKIRADIQEAIKTFILKKRETTKTLSNFNRFLITSRVAGYDQMAFPDYAHYTIAELNPQQIEDFLPRWYYANVRRNRNLVNTDLSEPHESIIEEAAQRAKDLATIVSQQQGVQELADNPLLLTLLAVMQQNSIELPTRRVELYRIVTLTLLENRNIAIRLPVIPEAQAIQRLGPLAFHMQERGNSFISANEMMNLLRRTIGEEGGTADEISHEAKIFLNRIRERGGLFVLRTGDYFGFFHRTFQEYFAARYILNIIERDSANNIKKLAEMAQRRDDLWREPFLLAVAYKSNENGRAASELIHAMLTTSQNSSYESRKHNLLLAAECLIEAKPLTIISSLERSIVEHLLQIYEEAEQTRNSEARYEIEEVMRRWLLSLPKEAYRPTVLVVLREIISDTSNTIRQRATLGLLIMIAERYASCPIVVFDILIPPLLALGGLASVAKYKPLTEFPKKIDFIISETALSVIHSMGRRGPSGLLLVEIRQYFKNNPSSLRLLARLSLEGGILLTPTILPLAEDRYNLYENTIEQWVLIHDHNQSHHITEQKIDICLNIHNTLLEIAEEACYPCGLQLLNMLRFAEENPGQKWQQIFINYFLNQLSSFSYINYQEMMWLWIILFPQEASPNQQVTLLLKHCNDTGLSVQRYAQHFIGVLSCILQDRRYLQDLNSQRNNWHLRYRRDQRGQRYIRYLRYLHKERYIFRIRSKQYLQEIKGRQKMLSSQNIRYMREMRKSVKYENLQLKRYSRDQRYVQDGGYLQYLKNVYFFQSKLFNFQAYESLIRSFHASFISNDLAWYGDFSSVLIGRLLQIVDADESGQAVEQEIQQMIQTVVGYLESTDRKDIYDILLNVLSYLPARSEKEIEMILQLEKETMDKLIQQTCEAALVYAEPKTPEGKMLLDNNSSN